MISGIGPKSTLQGLGIDVLLDKPGVGVNMWDHASFSLVQQVDVETLSGLTDPAKALKSAEDFNKTHSGILTSNGADFIGEYYLVLPFLKTYFRNSKVSNILLQDGKSFPVTFVQI